MLYKVDTDVPLPSRLPGGRRAMFECLKEPGHSIFVPGEDMSIGSLRNAASQFAKTTGITLSVSVEGSGARVFRR